MRIPLLAVVPLVLFSRSMAWNPDSDPQWILRNGVEMRSLWGTPLDRDRQLYGAMGLVLWSSDGTVKERVDPSYEGPALGLGIWRKVDSSFMVGLDLHAEWLTTQHNGQLASSAELAMSEQSALLSLRVVPFSVARGHIRFGAQGGMGLSQATLHRYALAAAAMDAWVSSAQSQAASAQSISTFQSYVAKGHDDLELNGWLWQARVLAQAEVRFWTWTVYMGAQGDHSKPTNDPLAGDYIYDNATGQITVDAPPTRYSSLQFQVGVEGGIRF
jgi:hypothetical protein